MTRDEVYLQLNEVFVDVFDDDGIVISDDTTSNDIEGWDSLENINLIVSVQSKFGIKFDMDEISSIKNVGHLVDLIIKHL